MEAEWNLFPVIRKRGTQKGFYAQEPQRVLLGTTRSLTEGVRQKASEGGENHLCTWKIKMIIE